MSILLDPDPARHRAAYVSAREAQRRRNHGILATRFGAAETEGISVTWVESGDAQDPVEASRPATSCFNEPVAPLPRLVIFGAGHVGQALARQASLLGVEIAVVDDRPEFCRPALFPPGARILCQNPDEAVRRLALDADTDVVLVGRGYRQDLEALACCVNAPVRYVGMIGSRRKVALVKRDLVASGRATAEALERVHAPIGLDIGAVTAAEIAVSIAAEWLAVVAGRRPCTRERA